MTDLPTILDFASLKALYGAGTRPAEVMATIADRMERCDPAAFIHKASRAELLAEAEALVERAPDPSSLPLWGLPFAVKDNIDVAGLPTTAACPNFAYHPEANAPVVARLRAAGAIVIGKTNLDQFATGLNGTRSPYGAPRCVFDAAYVSGGSSSGSAVAVASGLAAFALGTDTAGSGRVPAAFNNIVGIKPSPGRISTSGVVPACRSIDVVTIFAASVADGIAARRVAEGFDPADAYARRFAPSASPAPTNANFTAKSPIARSMKPPSNGQRVSAPGSSNSTIGRSAKPPRFYTKAPGSPNALRRSRAFTQRRPTASTRPFERSSRVRAA